jgi:ABC-2 type transport system ATP-binding protein
VLLLDEPANGLDPAGVRWLRGLLRDLAAEGRTVVVSSHVLAEVEQTVDEVLILERGRLLAHRAMSEIGSLEETFLTLTDEKDSFACLP